MQQLKYAQPRAARRIEQYRGGSRTARKRTALAVAFEGQLYETVEQFFVGEAARGPEFRVDARRGETWDGVDLVEQQPVRAAFEEEVDPRHTGRVYGLVGRSGDAPDLLCGLLLDRGGGQKLHPAFHVLGFVIVEAVFLDNDLTRQGDFRILVSEDGDFDLTGVHALLDDDAPVVARGRVEGIPQLCSVFGPADADARAEVRGLHEARVSEGVCDLLDPGLPIHLPLLAGQGDPPDLGEPMMGEDLLHGRLVHAGGAPQHPATHVGDAGELEHALYGAVLAVGTVQHGEDHVHGTQSRGKLLRYRGRWARDIEVGAVGQAADLRLQLAHRLSGGDPTPLPGYAYGHDFVTAALLKGLRYGACGGQGYFVFAAAAPEDDHHPDQCAAPLYSSSLTPTMGCSSGVGCFS